MKKKLFAGLATGLLVFGMVELAKATAVVYSDSFEGDSISQFWTLLEEGGTITLSNDLAFSGSQSLKLSSIDGVQRNLFAIHSFSESMRGTLSVMFYDSTVGQNAIGSALQTADRTTSPAKTNYIGVVDWNQSTYYTGNVESNYARSIGWHRFEMSIDESGTKDYIDGTLVYSTTQFNQFDYLSLFAQGPLWRPGATYYFDDFQINVNPVNEAAPVPEPATMLLFGTGIAGFVGSRLRWKKKA
jgi:hypothetical protein